MNNDQNRLHGKRLLDNYRDALYRQPAATARVGHRCHWTIGPIARNTPFPIDIALFVAVNYVISNEISRLKLCICKMAPIKVTPGVLAHRIVPLLPQDGTPVLNRVMRVMLDAFLDLRLIARVSAKLAPRIREAVSRTTHGGNQLRISFLPCGPHLRLVEREIIYSLTKKHSMKGIEGQTWILFQQEFLPLNLLYDYVIFDCPPGISPLTEVFIRASDLVIVPTIPDFISVFGLNAFCESIWKGPQSSLPRPKLLPHVLVTRCMVRPCVARGFVDLAAVRSCINVFGFSLELACSGPPWISARVRSH